LEYIAAKCQRRLTLTRDREYVQRTIANIKACEGILKKPLSYDDEERIRKMVYDQMDAERKERNDRLL